MKVEAGMYARTKYGISKIENISPNEYDKEHDYVELETFVFDGLDTQSFFTTDEIIKASHNIIDLIEVGDYVNGIEIVKIDYDPFIKGQVNLWTNIRNTNGFGDIEIMKIIDKDIKSIVTKEQFSSIEYKYERELLCR